MSELLFLAHRIPYPPNKGDKIRSWHFLQHLASRYTVHLGCFIDDPLDWAHCGKVAGLCGETAFLPLDPRRARLRSLARLATGEALSLGYFHDRRLARWVNSILTRSAVEHVFVFSSPMAQYVIGGRAGRRRIVVDFVDVDSDKWRQYAEFKTWPINMVYAREARRLLSFERIVAAQADASILVSDAEAGLFRSLVPGSAGRVHGIRNGVDLDHFDPELAFPRPYEADERAIVFTGAMDYWANVDGVAWFARNVLSSVRRAHPSARFWIVGANPAPEVLRLAEDPAVRVTGRVPDIRPYLAHADIVVAPLRIARGLQNKVLEAMAMARTVVATPQAVEGLATNRDEICIAEDAESYARACVEALAVAGRDQRGRAARRRVVKGYDWQSSLAALARLIEGAEPGPGMRAIERPMVEGVVHES